MAKTWRDIFEIDQEIDNARADERRTNLYDYVQKGGMTIDFAASEAGISTDQFRSEMTRHGYRVPQTI